MAEASSQASEPAVCKNCSSPATQALRCGVCKNATYCSPKCQKEDWQFHKRICKKPPPKEPEVPKADKGLDAEEAKRQMEELTKDKDPALAAQMQQMMAGMLGVEAPPPPPKAPEPPPPCQGCATPCAKPLRCGVCKAATYCSGKCQKEDWRFHKRICKKPAPAEGAPPAGEEAPSGEGAAAPSVPARPAGENDKVVCDDDVGSWYKHREYKPQEEFVQPKLAKLEPAASGYAAATSTAAAANAPAAWNKAGTWEDKNMLPWWQKRMQGLKGFIGDGDAQLQVDTVSEVTGDASIAHVRGQPKFMYDLGVTLSFAGLQNCKPCARSGDGSRCSNCVRFKGKLEVSDLSWACENDPAFRPIHAVADGPDHVKKADSSKLCDAATRQLVPGVKCFLADSVAAYKETVAASDAPKWASQLPPAAPQAAV